MNKILSTVLMTIALLFTGCNSTPTTESVTATAYACGIIAGSATELSKADATVKTTIVSVLDKASTVIPSTNETFTVAWTNVIQEDVAKLISEKKLTDESGNLVKTCAITVTSGLDYLFSRHPDWKNYQNFVSAAATGFISGYKSAVTQSATNTTDDRNVIKEDVEAFKTFMTTKK